MKRVQACPAQSLKTLCARGIGGGEAFLPTD
jgi:hypothetical protein